jgi:hypothetical protein
MRPLMTLLAAQILFAQAPTETSADALLARAREKILDSIRRLPKYTCVETTDRHYYLAHRPKPESHSAIEPAFSCQEAKFQETRKLRLDATDRLRLDVAVAGGDEIHSWPAASRFDTRPIYEMIPAGPTSSGAFGGLLVDIFNNRGATFEFKGRINNGQREVFEYSFRVPRGTSQYSVNVVGGRALTGFAGSFQIDTTSADLLRMTQESDVLPSTAYMCRVKVTSDYTYAQIGDGRIMIPRQSVLDTLVASGDQTSSVTVFSACHEYAAESSIRFDAADEPSNDSVRQSKMAAPLPKGVSLTLALTKPIDTTTAAAGDAVSAKVAHAVYQGNSKKLLVPSGAMVRGRILQVRHEMATSKLYVALRFDTLESHGAVSTLSVQLKPHTDGAAARSAAALKTRTPEFQLPPPGSGDGGSWFTFSSKTGNHIIKAGDQSDWITVR